MLTRERMESLINCQLPADEARSLLSAFAYELVDYRDMQALITCIREACVFKECAEVEVMDCSGTGGSGLPHFNTSTTVAFILAAGGIKVAKFGNRAATSLSGSFDLLTLLGIPDQIPFEDGAQLLEKVGLIFLFAPQFYPMLARLAPIRKSLSHGTVFNSIGPLLHPYKVTKRLMGVANQTAQRLTADYLSSERDLQAAIVVRSQKGLDEFDPADHSDYFTIKDGGKVLDSREPSLVRELTETEMPPRKSLSLFVALLGNAAPTYYKHLVCLNAGAGFVVSGLARTIDEGFIIAEKLLDGGDVARKYQECRRVYAKYLS